MRVLANAVEQGSEAGERVLGRAVVIRRPNLYTDQNRRQVRQLREEEEGRAGRTGRSRAQHYRTNNLLGLGIGALLLLATIASKEISKLQTARFSPCKSGSGWWMGLINTTFIVCYKICYI